MYSTKEPNIVHCAINEISKRELVKKENFEISVLLSYCYQFGEGFEPNPGVTGMKI
jgi:hypothetical protein